MCRKNKGLTYTTMRQTVFLVVVVGALGKAVHGTVVDTLSGKAANIAPCTSRSLVGRVCVPDKVAIN